MAPSTYLLSPAQLDKALLSQEELDAISKQVLTVAQEAIQWFDTARQVDQLADTAFTFTLVRWFDARVICKDGEATGFGWFKREEHTFKISCQSTASLRVEQIITVDALTEKLLAYLKRPVPQEVIEIKLSVQLFDLNKTYLAIKDWIIRMKSTSS
ncbi:MAG TPA: hypothetical protein VFU89_00615 [Rhabdochlamydiaceae bacterium]|nr:hypothetical protein [Rhabdochlamydiaceae bacterium]